MSVNADKHYKPVRKIKVGTASEQDIMNFEDVRDPANTNLEILANKSYVDGEQVLRPSSRDSANS